MIWSTIGRIALLASLLSVGTKFYFASPVYTEITAVSMYASTTFSSIMQVMVATEISAGMLKKHKSTKRSNKIVALTMVSKNVGTDTHH